MSMRYNKLRDSEQGFASIVIALILIVVMALILVGFAQLTRREETNTLDKQLSTQAFYAAESGVNDVLTAIQNKDIDDGTPNVDTGKCLDTSSTTSGLGGLINSNKQGGDSAHAPNIISVANDTTYSCVVLSLATPTLQYSNITPDTAESVVTDIKPSQLSNLTITWNQDNPPAGVNPVFETLGDFPASNAWSTSAPGVIEFSLTPFSSSTLDRSDLLKDNFTVYLYPSAGAHNTIPYSLANNGSVVPGDCHADGTCKVTIQNLPGGASSYLLHMLDLYNASDVTITGTDNSNKSVLFTNGQAVIDVTGHAQDTLKRIQVRVAIGNLSNVPNYAVEAQNICKREQVAPVDPVQNPLGTTFSEFATTDPLSPAASACDPEQ